MFDTLDRLLAAVKTAMRKRSSGIVAAWEALHVVAQETQQAVAKHMASEEEHVLPTLVAGLCPPKQRLLLWCAFSAMPLRILERTLPLLLGMLP